MQEGVSGEGASESNGEWNGGNGRRRGNGAIPVQINNSVMSSETKQHGID